MSLVSLKTKVLPGQTLGSCLRQRRTECGVSLQEASSDLSIPRTILKGVEDEDFSMIPEEVYRQRIVKRYAVYLGFSWPSIQGAYQQLSVLYAPLVTRSAVEYKKRPARFLMWSSRRIISRAVWAIVASICLMYTGSLVFSLVRAPALEVSAPQDNVTTRDSRMTIVGHTESDADVFINGLSVSRNRDGAFSQEVILQEGVNMLRVTAAKRYGHAQEVVRRVLFTPREARARAAVSPPPVLLES